MKCIALMVKLTTAASNESRLLESSSEVECIEAPLESRDPHDAKYHVGVPDETALLGFQT
jgi:hypothetical protein